MRERERERERDLKHGAELSAGEARRRVRVHVILGVLVWPFV
jgi:hypothetical protein